jgi:hypothetical protein
MLGVQNVAAFRAAAKFIVDGLAAMAAGDDDGDGLTAGMTPADAHAVTAEDGQTVTRCGSVVIPPDVTLPKNMIRL